MKMTVTVVKVGMSQGSRRGEGRRSCPQDRHISSSDVWEVRQAGQRLRGEVYRKA